MANYWKTCKHWYDSLEKREQLAVACLAVFIAAMLVVYGLLLPSHHYYRKSQQYVANQQATVAWLRANEVALRRSSNNKGASAGPEATVAADSLVSWITQAAAAENIALRRIEPGESGVRVWLDAVSESQFLNYVARVEKAGLHTGEITLSRSDKPGQVGGTLKITL